MKFKKGENVHVIAGNELLNGWYNGKEFGTGNSLVKVSRDKIISTKDCFIAKEKEAELVVVPKLIGDFLENHSKEDGHTLHDLLCDLLTSRASLDENVYDWIMENNNENGELFARAWLDGYEVEKEPLYYVRLPLSTWNDDAAELEVINMYVLLNKQSDETTFTGSIINKNKKWTTKLTEAEIKGMQKGEIYWLFAVPVEDSEGEA
ncbi:TPA: DUF1642 domain-containing protein [Listeria monocytogenes]|uniref:DUF1642 domain-containing protein n=1 Tax=Listeria monocytogenes TaxID=1639 RepID=A0AAX3BU90_LISMN|nr:DUF1642 domain-containing protein [Listeria monocytogenes]EAC2895863.1 DUF1642 domain-containing protein [Listeria monocytogenes]EAC8161167.1 DUF1642 domain-containing protein [Listeria monocytogenes]EAD1598576.1 DUF1642 domain-containing protein [Listeria monocytogenes]EAD1823287.1 DUF1642 domain-containing protein [Listeria monocytogenes]EAD3839357.1 DUF1642 domain-containing protein [Listeria monocytogenes]